MHQLGVLGRTAPKRSSRAAAIASRMSCAGSTTVKPRDEWRPGPSDVSSPTAACSALPGSRPSSCGGGTRPCTRKPRAAPSSQSSSAQRRVSAGGRCLVSRMRQCSAAADRCCRAQAPSLHQVRPGQQQHVSAVGLHTERGVARPHQNRAACDNGASGQQQSKACSPRCCSFSPSTQGAYGQPTWRVHHKAGARAVQRLLHAHAPPHKLRQPRLRLQPAAYVAVAGERRHALRVAVHKACQAQRWQRELLRHKRGQVARSRTIARTMRCCWASCDSRAQGMLTRSSPVARRHSVRSPSRWACTWSPSIAPSCELRSHSTKPGPCTAWHAAWVGNAFTHAKGGLQACLDCGAGAAVVAGVKGEGAPQVWVVHLHRLVACAWPGRVHAEDRGIDHFCGQCGVVNQLHHAATASCSGGPVQPAAAAVPCCTRQGRARHLAC